MGDCLLAERRHRHNQKMSELHRSAYPKFGHYDSWLTDQLMILVERNHAKIAKSPEFLLDEIIQQSFPQISTEVSNFYFKADALNNIRKELAL